MSSREISNMDDVIDSRDVIARIEELKGGRICVHCGDLLTRDGNTLIDTTGGDVCGVASASVNTNLPHISNLDEVDEIELATLIALQEEAEPYVADWSYGETLIRDSYFQEYAEQLADDIGAINSNATWPNNCIDWERAARELQHDYTSVDFDGVTYWIR